MADLHVSAPGADHGAPLPSVPGLDVLGPIARGGHGTVYRARELRHDRMVALKVLDARFLDEATRRRFDRERLALGRLSDHPAIVSLLDSGDTAEGLPYLVLEFAPGGSLADHVGAGHRLSVGEATSVGIALAGALESAHQAGVVHRDVKPDNVIRSTYGSWMLTDFGVAALVDHQATGVVHATYAHAPPEVFDGMVGPIGDVYSLASLLATALTGVEPFAVRPDEGAIAVMHRIATEPYPDLRHQGVPDALAELLNRTLSNDPDQRPQSAHAFAAELNRVRAELGFEPEPIRTADGGPAASTMIHAPKTSTGTLGSKTQSGTEKPGHKAGGARASSSRKLALTAVAVVLSVGATVGVVQATLGGDGTSIDVDDDPPPILALRDEVPPDAVPASQQEPTVAPVGGGSLQPDAGDDTGDDIGAAATIPAISSAPAEPDPPAEVTPPTPPTPQPQVQQPAAPQPPADQPAPNGQPAPPPPGTGNAGAGAAGGGTGTPPPPGAGNAGNGPGAPPPPGAGNGGGAGNAGGGTGAPPPPPGAGTGGAGRP
ncbi:MAG: serine/threonine-protein kinase [Actinomycetota bacterium]